MTLPPASFTDSNPRTFRKSSNEMRFFPFETYFFAQAYSLIEPVHTAKSALNRFGCWRCIEEVVVAVCQLLSTPEQAGGIGGAKEWVRAQKRIKLGFLKSP